MPLLIFMIGACFGSFISCMSHRYMTHESILGRSHCDYCGHTLHVLDLIQSYLIYYLKGNVVIVVINSIRVCLFMN